MKPNPLWMSNGFNPSFPTLTGKLKTDVVVVGAGIAGLTAAFELRAHGKKVIVVDKGRVGHGESGHTTAHLTQITDLRYHEMIAQFGQENATFVAQSSSAAIDFIERRVGELKVDCGFRRLPGFLFSEKPQCVEELEKEYAALHEVGIPARRVHRLPLPWRIHAGLQIERQAQFHPMRYLGALAQYLHERGVAIYENSPVHHVEEETPCRVESDLGSIEADDIFIAAHVPICNRLFLQTKLAAYRSYVIAARIRGFPEAAGLFWDMDEPYHYLRGASEGGETLAIFGGEDHKTGATEDTNAPLDRLATYLKERFDVQEILYRWSGQIMETVDGLPYIGQNTLSEHSYVASGFSGNGMTFGTLAGILVADEILNRPNPWADIYRATRVMPVAGAKDFIRENKDFPVCYLGDRMKPYRLIEEIAIGEGAIVSLESGRVALYNDPEEGFKALSPVCPHMGCYVRWNAGETSWDCPCHGSRFSTDGDVLNGPALEGLKPVELAPQHFARPDGAREKVTPASARVEI